MLEIIGGGIVKALPVFLQAVLAFHRHIGEGTRESHGLLAKALDVKPQQVRIIRGHSQSRKIIEVEGMDEATLRTRLKTN